MKKPLVSYAQHREDLILYVLLHTVKKGFYVDIGANHPDQDSVTKFFYKRGWKGINIEPVKFLHQHLEKARPRDINLNVGVAQEIGQLNFREYGDHKHGLSTFSQQIRETRPKGEKYHDRLVSVLPLRDIFLRYEVGDIDFLKVDVEGFEYEALAGNDWDKFRPRVIVVENTPGKWITLLKRVGYKQVFFDGLNRYFVRNDLIKVHTMDDYGLLLEGNVLTYSQFQDKKQINMLNDRLCQQIAQNTALNLNWLEMNKHPEKFLGLRLLGMSLLRRIIIRLFGK